MGFLNGKRALIVGLLNERSIAYGIAKCMHREGAQLAFTYQNDKIKERVAKIATPEFNSNLLFQCDLGSDDEINNVFTDLAKSWDSIDIVVHSAAFAPPEQLVGDYVELATRDSFRIAHDISSYSLTALAKAAKPMMKNRNGALLAISYIGSIRAIPDYNVMGVAKASLEANVRYLAASLGKENIRVNTISAGPIKTISGSAVKNLRKRLSHNEKVVPLRRNITLDDIGNAAAFLCSDLAAGITGDILYVDSGFHITVGTTDEEEEATTTAAA
jgi:enoyl-[acyl-carrier protein] reductase I